MKRVIKICIFGVLLVLAGCRSESLVETEELHQENAKKIVFFENYAKNKNYKYDAEWLNYDDVNNPAIPFAQTLRAYLMNNERDVQEIARQYGRLDLEVSSPVFTDDKTGRQLVYFPILKGKEVSAVLSCVVEKDFSRMGFAVYPKSENLKGIIAEFQSHYFNETRLLPLNRGKNKEGDGSKDNPKNIEGITIVKILAPPNDFCMSFYMGVESEGNDCEGKDGVRRDIAGLIDPWKNPFPDWFPDGGGDEPPPTPCERINNNNNKSKDIMNNQGVANKISEMSRNIRRDVNEKSFTFGKDTNGVYKTSDIKEGNGNMAAPFSPINSSFTTEGIIHTHTPDLYSAQSVGDIYSLYNANSLNNNFIYNFAISIGETYVISIVDADKFKRFNQQYPESEYFDVENVDWKEGTVIRKDFDRAHHQFLQSGMNTNDTFGYAMASVMKKYDMGVTISKRPSDSQGEFKTLYVNIQENTNIRNRHNRYNYTKTENCNH